jgi:hypothetical protein
MVPALEGKDIPLNDMNHEVSTLPFLDFDSLGRVDRTTRD